jgi:general secretion pathway protein L
MNLQTTIDLDIKGFFRWWSRELSFLVPQQIKNLIHDNVPTLIFDTDDQGFHVYLLGDDDLGQSAIDQFFLLGDADAYQNLKQRFPEIEKAICVLRLRDGQATAKQIYLPEAAQENLQQVVGFELDRYTPFTADQVYFDALTLTKTGQGQIEVLLVITPIDIMESFLAHLNVWGVKPVRVEYQDVIQSHPQLLGHHNLLPDHYQPESNKFAQSVHWFLTGLALVLLLAVLFYPVWIEKQAVDFLKLQLKSLEKETDFVEAQQLEITRLQEETQKLIAIKQQEPELIEVLNELTRLLKDDTWLTNLQYSDKHMQIQGQSPAASSLISTLEESPYFSQVAFVSPLTQDKATNLERFQISMNVQPKPVDANAVGNETPQSEPPQDPQDRQDPENIDDGAGTVIDPTNPEGYQQ